jgi:integrase
MPRGRKPKPPRLYLRRRDGREPQWIILDAGKQSVTGCGERDSEGAEKALALYLIDKYRAPTGPSGPDQMSLARALEIYGRERAPHVASPETIGYHISALLPFWGLLPVVAIKGETCRAYVKFRKTVKPATAKRELQTLGAAVNYCHREGYLTYAPRITVPKTGKSKTRWLTREEAAALLRGARHAPHLRTFILIGLYTGTRSAAILNLQWMPNVTGGWVDLERGLLYRGADERIETNKRQTTCPIPEKLIAHLRRVRARTRQFCVEYDASPIRSVKTSWRETRARAGLGKDVTPHTLRHTAVTWLMLNGIKIWDAAHYVGMSEKMVRDRYGHHHPEFLKEARDAL